MVGVLEVGLPPVGVQLALGPAGVAGGSSGNPCKGENRAPAGGYSFAGRVKTKGAGCAGVPGAGCAGRSRDPE